MEYWKLRAVLWMARALKVPIKVRDTYWGAPHGTSHVALQPSLTISGEAHPS